MSKQTSGNRWGWKVYYENIVKSWLPYSYKYIYTFLC